MHLSIHWRQPITSEEEVPVLFALKWLPLSLKNDCRLCKVHNVVLFGNKHPILV